MPFEPAREPGLCPGDRHCHQVRAEPYLPKHRYNEICAQMSVVTQYQPHKCFIISRGGVYALSGANTGALCAGRNWPGTHMNSLEHLVSTLSRRRY